MRAVAAVSDVPETHDLLVIGAGPAGLAAAVTASDQGLSTLVVDENAALGGQIYRGLTTTPVVNRAILGRDYWRGTELADAFAASNCTYLPGAAVWTASAVPDEPGMPDGFEVGISREGSARLIRARRVLAATGALERPFPIPGWTLPGVMTAGAAQIALKTAGLVPQGRVVVAGCGPLLYLLVAQLRAAGAPIVALLDTTPRGNWRDALPYAAEFLRSPYLAKGLKLLAGAHRGMRLVRGVTGLAATGRDHVDGVIVRRGNREELIACDTLLLHQGVVPNINLSNALGCQHAWDDAQRAWAPVVDSWFGSSIPGLSIAGDGAGIAGAESAALRGRIAALGMARQLGRLDEGRAEHAAAPWRRQLASAGRGRRFLDALYRPAEAFRAPPHADTVVCRCEEITAGQIRSAVALGVTGPNQLKAFLRAGMGPCQGRMCGLTVTEIIAQARGVPPDDVGGYRLRPPVKPITLRELASLPVTDAARRAVER